MIKSKHKFQENFNYQDSSMSGADEKIKLFDSDGEEETYDDFQIRPQYQGPHGHKILELNSQLSERFKLDERFAEDSEPESAEVDDKHLSGENEEKKNNIRILESILGHEVIPKPLDRSFTKKRQIRYDPDDESASKLIKVPDTVMEKPKNKKKKKKTKMIVEENAEQNIPVSTERYVEVVPDLKEILNTATPFSFSQKFGSGDDQEESILQNDVSPQIAKETKFREFENKSKSKVDAQGHGSTVLFTPKSKYEFFFSESDPRLKEGIHFFKRPKPLEEIRVEWQKRREHVLELFRRKRRPGQRSQSNRVQNMQMKNNIRRNNFKM